MPRPRSNLTIGTTLAVVLLLLAICLRPALDQFRQRGTVASIERSNARCEWEWAPTRPVWIFGRMSDARKRWGDWVIGATIRGLGFDSQQLNDLKDLPYLRRLELFNSSVSRKRQTVAIENFSQLEGLGFSGLFHIATLKIRRCPKLVYLSFNHIDIENLAISDLPLLEELTLRNGNTSEKQQRINLSGVPNLRKLYAAEDSRLVENQIVKLHDFPELESIYFRMVQVRSVDFSDVPKLRRIQIYESRFDDSGIPGLCGLQELNLLRLVDCNLTDAGLAKLDDLPLLETLDLQNTYVTLQGLAGLGRFPRLREVITDRPLTTNEHRQLQQVLPGVIITCAPTRSSAPTRLSR